VNINNRAVRIKNLGLNFLLAINTIEGKNEKDTKLDTKLGLPKVLITPLVFESHGKKSKPKL
jgi:hypothetical protein